MTPDDRIKANMARVLSTGVASGSIGHIRIGDFNSMCEAMRDIMSESYIAGSNACHKVMAGDRPTCEWAQDDEGNWGTSCGNLHAFIEDGPVENNHKFCPYCGGRLEVQS